MPAPQKLIVTPNNRLINRDVACVLYLPQASLFAEPLHLLLVNDGQDLDTMQYQTILQDLYQKEIIKPVLAVGIKAGENRLLEYGVAGKPDFKNRGSQADLYQNFI